MVGKTAPSLSCWSGCKFWRLWEGAGRREGCKYFVMKTGNVIKAHTLIKGGAGLDGFLAGVSLVLAIRQFA